MGRGKKRAGQRERVSPFVTGAIVHGAAPAASASPAGSGLLVSPERLRGLIEDDLSGRAASRELTEFATATHYEHGTMTGPERKRALSPQYPYDEYLIQELTPVEVDWEPAPDGPVYPIVAHVSYAYGEEGSSDENVVTLNISGYPDKVTGPRERFLDQALAPAARIIGQSPNKEFRISPSSSNAAWRLGAMLSQPEDRVWEPYVLEKLAWMRELKEDVAAGFRAHVELARLGQAAGVDPQVGSAGHRAERELQQLLKRPLLTGGTLEEADARFLGELGEGADAYCLYDAQHQHVLGYTIVPHSEEEPLYARIKLTAEARSQGYTDWEAESLIRDLMTPIVGQMLVTPALTIHPSLEGGSNMAHNALVKVKGELDDLASPLAAYQAALTSVALARPRRRKSALASA